MAFFVKPDAPGLPAAWAAILNKDVVALETILNKTPGQSVNISYGGFRESLMHIAAKTGHVPTVELLLNRGSDINIQSFNGNTPLYIAIYYGQEAVAELLVRRKCDVNRQDVTHRSPLMLSIEKGFTSLTRILFDHPDIDLTQTDRRRRNILHYAVISRNVSAIEMLTQKSATRWLSNQPDRLGIFPILMAARKGYLDIMNALLHGGANPNVYDTRFNDHHTALEEAILNGHHQVVLLLLKSGAVVSKKRNINQNGGVVNQNGAVVNQNGGVVNQNDTVRYVDTSPDTPDVYPILVSLMTNHERTDILQALLEEGADCNLAVAGRLYTPLRLAVDQNYFLMAKMLVLANCDLASNKNWILDYHRRQNNSVDMQAFLEWVLGFLPDGNQPNRLSYYCRDRIRSTVEYKQPMAEQVTKLPIPQKLKNFLLFRDMQ